MNMPVDPTLFPPLSRLLRHCLALALGLAATLTSSAGDDGFTVINSVAELRRFAVQDDVRVRMTPGTYQLNEATDHHFIRFTGRNSHFDLRGVTLQIDNALFRKFGVISGPDGFYCALDLSGDGIVFEGITTVNVGEGYGIGGRNKIINISGSGVTLRDADITTSGSNPWGYGSLFGISKGDVRKMNGIRVGWPAKGSKLIGCRVHMRAMGHAIFVQGVADTLIEDCQVDGLLRPTNEILKDTSGYAFDRGFRSTGKNYVEGVTVGPDGHILPDEMISLSEDGIRLYSDGGDGHPTGPTTIRRCTVRQMRRGICTGLGPGADRVIDCEVLDCVAAGFNIGSGDRLENCRANARYAEALSCPYHASRGAVVDLEILDSRAGLANDLLATINGRNHQVHLHTRNPAFVPQSFVIEQGTNRGYAFYQKGTPVASGIALQNETPARVVPLPRP